MGKIKRIIEVSFPYRMWTTLKWLKKSVRIAPSTLILGNHGNIKIGSKTKIGSGTVLDVISKGDISIGENCWFYKDCEMRTSGSISIGNGVTFQKGVTLNGNIKIGAGCILAPNIFISSGTHIYNFMPSLPIRHQEKIFSERQEIEKLASFDKPVSIGEDCWLGINTVVSPGVEIGRGCIIGASSVVTKSLPPYSIAAGVPAKVIGSRLAWLPLKNIDATKIESAAYLYEGFDLIHKDHLFAYIDKSKIKIMIPVVDSEMLEIEFDSTISGSIEIEGTTKSFKSGLNKVSFNLRKLECEKEYRCLDITVSIAPIKHQFRLLSCKLI